MSGSLFIIECGQYCTTDLGLVANGAQATSIESQNAPLQPSVSGHHGTERRAAQSIRAVGGYVGNDGL